MQKDPSEEDVYSPEFDAIWKVIQHWNIQHLAAESVVRPAAGTDVMTILNAIRTVPHICWSGPEVPPSVQKGADLNLQFFKGCRSRFGHYNIGKTKVLMLGPIRIFVSKDG